MCTCGSRTFSPRVYIGPRHHSGAVASRGAELADLRSKRSWADCGLKCVLNGWYLRLLLSGLRPSRIHCRGRERENSPAVSVRPYAAGRRHFSYHINSAAIARVLRDGAAQTVRVSRTLSRWPKNFLYMLHFSVAESARPVFGPQITVNFNCRPLSPLPSLAVPAGSRGSRAVYLDSANIF
jgi:hypothetical protein